MKHVLSLSLICGLLLLLGVSIASANLNTPAAYWSCNLTHTDASGNGHTLTNSGQAYQSGIIGNSCDNEESESDYARVSWQPSKGDITISMWIRLESAAGYGRPLHIGDGDNAPQISFFPTDASPDDITARVRDDNNDYTTIDNSLPLTEWEHLVIRIDEQGATDEFTFWMNGTLIGNETVDFDATDWSGTYTYLGARDSLNQYFDGLIDEVAIYEEKLTKTQILTLYNGGSGFSPYVNASGAPPATNATTPRFSLHAQDYYTGASINEFGAVVNGTNYHTTNGTIITTINQSKGYIVNITYNNKSYYFNSTITNFDTSANITYNITPYVVLHAIDATDNTTINQFIINNGTKVMSTTNGTLRSPLYNTTWTLTIKVPGYNNISDTINASPRLRAYNFTGLYPDPSSVTLNIYDIDTGDLINENVTVTVTNSSTQVSYIVNGTRLLGNLTAGSYTFKFFSSSYGTASYVVTVGKLTHQTLNAYLQSINGDVVFTVLNDYTGEAIINASMDMARFVNGTYTTIESHKTDITGKAQFGYQDGIEYRFTVSKSGFTGKTFILDPVIFDTYNIRLVPTVTITDPQSYANVRIEYYPRAYYEDAANNVTFVFISPDGTFTSYNVTLSYPRPALPDTGFTVSGSNAVGEHLHVVWNQPDVDPFLTVNFTYCYSESTGYEHCFYRAHDIIQTSAGNYTIIGAQEHDYGLGLFELVVLGTLVLVFSVGLVSYYAGGIAGGIIGIIVLGMLYWAGVFSLWMVVLPVLLVGFMVAWRGGT